MTLDEAIEHAKEKACDPTLCAECRGEHDQLAKWLVELREAKELLSECRNLLDVKGYGDSNLVEVVYYSPVLERLLLDIARICDKVSEENKDEF